MNQNQPFETLLSQFESALQSQDMGRAKETLEKAVASLTPEDLGDFYREILQAYMKTKTAINNAYLETLEETIKGLRDIEAVENSLPKVE